MNRVLGRVAGAQVFACMAAGYVLSYGLRSVNAVIAPELVAEFGLSNAGLGMLSAAYFVAFAALQLPLGIWLDRYGSRRTNAVLLLLAALGCIMFALAQSPVMLWFGRALIGAGVSGALMASLRAYRFWFVARRQQQLIAWMLVTGTLGAVLVTVPVRLSMPLIGWRGIFMLAAAMLALVSLALWRVLPRDEPLVAGGAETASVWRGYLLIFGDRYFWRFGLVAIILQSGFISFQSLWIGPWLTTVLGYSPEQAAQGLFLFNLMLMGGFLLIAWLLPGLEARGWPIERLLPYATLVVILLHLAVVLADGALALGLWIAYAIVATLYAPAQSHVSLSFPEALTGRAFTGFNLLIFLGVFAAQWLFGVLVDLASPGPIADALGFRRALAVWTGLELFALIWFILWRASPHCAAEGGNITR